MKSLSKKKVFVLLATCFISVVLFALFNKYYNDQPNRVNLTLEVNSQDVEAYQVYFDVEGTENWSEVNSTKSNYTKTSQFEKLKFSVESDTKNIRIDLGNTLKDVEVRNITLKKNGKSELDSNTLNSLLGKVNDAEVSIEDNGLINVKVTGNDPYLLLNNVDSLIKPIVGKPAVYNWIMMAASLILGFIAANSLRGVKEAAGFIKLSLSNTGLIKSLSKNDFRNKYASSYLGIVWGFINPLVTIAVYWFVFQVGFRSGDVGDVPYVLWFVTGIIPWFFFSDALPSTSNVFLEYSYLVKKVVFKIEILPTVKIISSLFVHLFFVLFIYVLTSIYGYYPDTYTLQFIYYSFAMIVLVYSLSLLTSSIILFFRDLGQIIGIVVSVGFWATPIGWQITMLPGIAQRLFKLNPMYYIVTGYRDAFVDKIYFWQRPYETLYFWVLCFVILCIGSKMFKKLKPHFSDVL